MKHLKSNKDIYFYGVVCAVVILVEILILVKVIRWIIQR
jgi:hypothetical protein